MSNLNLTIESLGYRWKGIYSASLAYKERDVVYYNGGAYVIRGGTPQPFALGQQDAVVKGALLTGSLGVTGVPGQALFANADGSIGFRFSDDRNGTSAISILQGLNKGGCRAFGGPNAWMSAIMSDGSVRSWGQLGGGQGGVGGGLRNVCMPQRASFPPGTPRIAAVYGSYVDAYFLDVNGGLWFSGGNGGNYSSGLGISGAVQFPKLINGNSGSTGIPANAVITALHTSQYDEYGNPSYVAIDSQGRAYSWGYNGYGNLGDGSSTNITTAKLIPFTVTTPIKEAFVFGGTYPGTALLDYDGNVWCAGETNTSGLGFNSSGLHKRLDTGGKRIKKMCHSDSADHSTGLSNYRTLAFLMENGDLYLRGDAGAQTRGGFTHGWASPITGTPELTNVEDCYFVNGAYEKGVCLMKDGTIKYKGWAGYYQDFNIGATLTSWTTVGGTMLSGITKLRAFGSSLSIFPLALTNQGKLITWGANGGYGVYGTGVSSSSLVTSPWLLDKTIIDFSVAGYSNGNAGTVACIYALTSDGNIYACGAGDNYRNGDDDSDHCFVPMQIRF